MKCHRDNRTLFPDGAKVRFTIDAAEVKTNGKKEYMEVKAEITDGSGSRNVIYENVMPWKMEELLTAIGKPPSSDSFDAEPDDLLGESGECMVYIDNFAGKDKNKVRTWVPAPPKPKLNELGEPDDVPF
jgi:hypothetical protein